MSKDFLLVNEERHQRQAEALKAKDDEIRFLRSIVTKLSQRLEHLETEVGSISETCARTDLDVVDMRRDFDSFSEDMHRQLLVIKSDESKCQNNQVGPSGLQCLGTFVGHEAAVWALSTCESQNLLFSVSADATVKVWDTALSYQCVATIEGCRDTVLCVEAHSDSQSITVCGGCSDGSLTVWKAYDPENPDLNFSVQHRNPCAHKQSICCMAAVDGSRLITGSYGSVRIWKNDESALTNESEIIGGDLPPHWIRSLMSFDGQLYIVCERVLTVWDLETLKCVNKANLPETTPGCMYCLTFVAENGILAAGTSEGFIQLWALKNLENLFCLSGHNGTVQCLSQQPNANNTLISGAHDDLIKLWDIGERTCTKTISKHEGPVTSLVSAPLESRIYSASVDCTIKVWNCQK